MKTTPEQIYAAAKEMTKTELKEGLETLKAEEKKLFKSLVSLGDSEELAFQTVLAEREKVDNYADYYKAYCS